MNLWQLVNKEIRFRKVGFAIGMVSIAVAIASLVGSVTLLRAYEVRTEQILATPRQGRDTNQPNPTNKTKLTASTPLPLCAFAPLRLCVKHFLPTPSPPPPSAPPRYT